LDLSEKEVGALRRALESYLIELAQMASHTDRYDVERALWERQAVLQGVLNRLVEEAAATP
jgi:hypothetical protein